MGLFDSAADWRRLGQAFGLRSFQPSAGYAPGVSFLQLKRSLGLPADHEAPSFDHWHYGVHRGVEVIILTYSVGSGSSSTTYTGVMAQIDPPLFLGLDISKRPTLMLFGPPKLTTGNPYVDDELIVGGFDMARVLAFLGPRDVAMHDAIVRIATNNMHITDSIVNFATEGYELDIERTRWQLDTVMFLAEALAARRRTLAPTPHEIAHRREWQRFAESFTPSGSSPFSFDPERMTLSGVHAGAIMKIALETERQEIRTSVTVRFPREVHVAFTVRRTAWPGFLQGIFGQDIKCGDRAFDEMFVVTGCPEPLVRQALGRPELLRTMVLLGGLTTEVQLNHQRLFFRVASPTASADVLASICETGRITCAALFGEVSTIGPYR